MMAKNDSNPQLNILILSIHQEMGENFVHDICPDATAGSGELEVDGTKVRLDVLAGDPRLNASWDQSLQQADALILITRFLDVISIDKMKAIYRRLPGEAAKPLAVVVVREEGETDFKISCPICGQKLWVRDVDSNKRGRCPNCKKAFTLPNQNEHLKAQLALADSVPVMRAISGNSESARGALSKLAARMVGGVIEQPGGVDQKVLKQATIRVQVSPEDM